MRTIEFPLGADFNEATKLLVFAAAKHGSATGKFNDIQLTAAVRRARDHDMTTIYKLTWGAGGHVPEQTRFFHPTHASDAAMRFAERVIEMDRDLAISAAYVNLKRLPDSIFPEGMDLMAWTKTSDERRTVDGETTAEAALSR